MEPLLFSCFLAALIVTLFLVPKWIKSARKMGLEGADMNKPKRPMVAEAGGITVIIGAAAGLLLYISIKTFYFSSPENLVEVFAVLVTLLLAGFVGFIDDILGWKVGMRHLSKVLSTIPIAIPLAVVNAGDSIMTVPLIGGVDVGFLFPLVIIPLGIIGATNGFNMVAGYNGMETGMGIVILSALSLVAWVTGSGLVSVLGLVLVFALLGFLWYNRPPARVFPGDSLTYAVGAAIACVAILGSMERLAIILFIPYFFDMFMYFFRQRPDEKKGMKVEAFAKVNPDGSLEMPHKKIYGFEHLGIWVAKKIKRKVYEKDVVLAVIGIEIVLAAITLALWSLGIV